MIQRRNTSKPLNEELLATKIATEKEELKDIAIDMVRFVLKFGGGSDPIFIRKIDHFSKTLRSRNHIPAVILKNLNDAKLLQAPEWIIACYMAALCCPQSFCNGSPSTLWTSADVNSWSGALKTNVLAARDAIQAHGEWASKQDFHEKLAVTLAWHDVRVVMHTSKKKAKGLPEYESIKEIGFRFKEDLEKHKIPTDGVPVPSYTKKEQLAAKETKKSKDKSAPVLKEFSADGEVLIESALQQGFELGGQAEHVKTKKTFTIFEIIGNTLDLLPVGDEAEYATEEVHRSRPSKGKKRKSQLSKHPPQKNELVLTTTLFRPLFSSTNTRPSILKRR